MSRPASPRVVAHIVDRLTGGVPVAVRTYVESSSSAYAHTVVAPFVDGAPAPIWQGLDVRHIRWDAASPVTALRDLRRILGAHRFDVIHAHSSYPGAYVRLLRAGRRTRVVYTPHCYAFLRTDVSPVLRSTFRLSERLLAGGASMVAACGPGERNEALALGVPGERTTVVPNLPSILPGEDRARRGAGDPSVLRVGMLGRWAPQKDPDYFLGRVEHLRAALPAVTVAATWIGDGPSSAPRVRVTGWAGRDDVRAELAELDVYFHTAAWEGFPIAILDAAAMGLPILARRIPALPDLPDEVTLEGGAGSLISAVRSGGFAPWSIRNRAMWADYLGPRDPISQRRALERAWG